MSEFEFHVKELCYDFFKHGALYGYDLVNTTDKEIRADFEEIWSELKK